MTIVRFKWVLTQTYLFTHTHFLSITPTPMILHWCDHPNHPVQVTQFTQMNHSFIFPILSSSLSHIVLVSFFTLRSAPTFSNCVIFASISLIWSTILLYLSWSKPFRREILWNVLRFHRSRAESKL